MTDTNMKNLKIYFVNIVSNSPIMINKKRWRGKPTLARGKNPPPPSTNGCHYMTFVLENKIVEKDLPILGLDDLGLPRLGKN